jgi:hypothetical protein
MIERPERRLYMNLAIAVELAEGNVASLRARDL